MVLSIVFLFFVNEVNEKWLFLDITQLKNVLKLIQVPIN